MGLEQRLEQRASALTPGQRAMARGIGCAMVGLCPSMRQARAVARQVLPAPPSDVRVYGDGRVIVYGDLAALELWHTRIDVFAAELVRAALELGEAAEVTGG